MHNQPHPILQRIANAQLLAGAHVDHATEYGVSAGCVYCDSRGVFAVASTLTSNGTQIDSYRDVPQEELGRYLQTLANQVAVRAIRHLAGA